MRIGDTLPGDCLFITNQGETNASDLRGRKLVVYFYPKDDTPGCTTEGKDFATHLQEFDAADCRVIGVSKDSLARHKKFSDKYAFRFDLASDEDGKLCERFDVWKEKSMYGKKYMGIERATFLFNAQGKLTNQWRKVKVPGHVAEVLVAAKT